MPRSRWQVPGTEWVQILRGPRPPSVKWPKAGQQQQRQTGGPSHPAKGQNVPIAKARVPPTVGPRAHPTAIASGQQAVRKNFSGCGRGDPEVAGGDCSAGRLDSPRETSPGSPSSCPGTSFCASCAGACGILQALLGTCQEAGSACPGGDRQSLRAESPVRGRGCRGRGPGWPNSKLRQRTSRRQCLHEGIR